MSEEIIQSDYEACDEWVRVGIPSSKQTARGSTRGVSLLRPAMRERRSCMVYAITTAVV